MAVPKLGTTTTTEYSFTKAICQSTGGWLFCRSRIWKFYFRLRLALRLGGMGLAFPLILLGLLSCLDRLSIRRNAEKSSEEIFSKGICNLSQNSWISISVSLPCPMLGLDDGTSGRLGQWVFRRTPEKAGSANGDQTILAFVLSARGAWDDADNDTLMQTLHGELEQTLGRPLPRPAWHRVIRERRATFSCRPNLPRPSTRTLIRGLWLAGDYVCADYPATLEGAVRSGISAAQAILA